MRLDCSVVRKPVTNIFIGPVRGPPHSGHVIVKLIVKLHRSRRFSSREPVLICDRPHFVLDNPLLVRPHL